VGKTGILESGKSLGHLNQFTNAPLNELYTCFRVNPKGRVMPTLVFRQIPFTSEDFKSEGPVTRFMNIPRWNIDTALILEADLGREEAARINFVQYFGKSSVGKDGTAIALEIAQGNYFYDQADITRSGLRPYVITSEFDEIGEANKITFRSPVWAKVMADALIGGHLKMNGTILSAGIVDPIAVGDNLEFDGVVYHIEQVQHNCSYDAGMGRRTFRTTISLSHGIRVESNAAGTRYPGMNNTGAYAARELDAQNANILPGVSESQSTVYRKAPDDPDNEHSKNSSFAQPSGGTKFSSRKTKG